MHTAQWTGGVLVVAGSLVLAGYGVYFYFAEFFGSPDVPIPVKIAIPVLCVGTLILLFAVFFQRYQARSEEAFKKEEF